MAPRATPRSRHGRSKRLTTLLGCRTSLIRYNLQHGRSAAIIPNSVSTYAARPLRPAISWEKPGGSWQVTLQLVGFPPRQARSGAPFHASHSLPEFNLRAISKGPPSDKADKMARSRTPAAAPRDEARSVCRRPSNPRIRSTLELIEQIRDTRYKRRLIRRESLFPKNINIY